MCFGSGLMTAARQVIAGRTYLMSRRCTQRQFMLRPDVDGEVEDIYLYCLAEAAERYNITLHGFVAMSNHQHIIARDNRANFPEFLAHLDKMIAKVMNSRLDRCENFWATEQPNAVYLVEASDRFAKLVYVLANPVAGHLVDCVSDWPGAISFGLNLSGGTRIVKRPRYFRPKGKMPAEVTLRLERLDGFEGLSDDEWVAQLKHAVRVEEERARDARRRRGHGVVGRQEIFRTDPTDNPDTPRRTTGLRPHIACRNPLRRAYELLKLLAFRAVREAALVRTLAGERDVLFPFGTYRIRGFFLTTPPPLSVVA
jgi:putative transposase